MGLRASFYLYQKQHLWLLVAQVDFGGIPECMSLLADELQFANCSDFSAVAGQQQSDPCRPHRCWLSQSQQSETSPRSPPRLPLCSWKREEDNGLYNSTEEVNTILGFTVHRHVQGQVSFAMRLADSCHLQIWAQFLCIIHPHISGDTMGPGLVAHSYDPVRIEYITNKFKRSHLESELRITR